MSLFLLCTYIHLYFVFAPLLLPTPSFPPFSRFQWYLIDLLCWCCAQPCLLLLCSFFSCWESSWYPLVDFFSFNVWIWGCIPWLSKFVLADQFHSNLCSFTFNVTFFFYVFYVFLTRLWAPWRQVCVVYGCIPVKSTEEVFNTYILNGWICGWNWEGQQVLMRLSRAEPVALVQVWSFELQKLEILITCGFFMLTQHLDWNKMIHQAC